MSRFYERLSRILSDPFGLREISETHEPILHAMEETKERAKIVRVSRFPISAQVGNPRLRRRENYAHN